MDKPLVAIYKSLTQLPLSDTINYFFYQLQLQSGLVRISTPANSTNKNLEISLLFPNWFEFLQAKDTDLSSRIDLKRIITRADRISEGKISFFGEIERDLNLDPGQPLTHWSKRHLNNLDNNDIKFIWEPARFGWAIQIAQAFKLTQDEKYARFFWAQFQDFKQKNPLNMGPNWSSAQEVALRLIAWVMSLHFLQPSVHSNPQALADISIAIADHADRIMATLSYAKAQNNNHLLSEAAGLYTAGTFLSNHPQASKWREKGLSLFEKAIQRQVDHEGEYIQHSTNYHRLMLTLSIWMAKLLKVNRDVFQNETKEKIKCAVIWLSNLLDFQSGQVPNLGHNDGSLILPLSSAPYSDYRPVIQAASNEFFARSFLPSGVYDDLAIWLGVSTHPAEDIKTRERFHSPRIGDENSWAIIRAKRYNSRPAHADQLHIDLWYQGTNVLLDAGTYQYNAPKPWDNGLSTTRVHNTLTIGQTDQMTRAGRFLWLDWAQAHISEYSDHKIIAAHDGYLNLGAVHERTLVKKSQTHWQIFDYVYRMKAAKKPMSLELQWLVPDFDFKILDESVCLTARFGIINIQTRDGEGKILPAPMIFRAGRSVTQPDFEKPLLGWYSPTYGVKQPALSILYSFKQKLPVSLRTDINFE
jgi:hypothetical protein